MTDTTATENSMTTPTTEGRSAFIRPTPIERAMGRLMRAPDHDAGAADAGAADAGASGDGGDAGATDQGAAGADAGAAAGGDDTILGSAAADQGAGDDKGGDDKGEKVAAVADAPVVPETYELKLTTKNEAGEDTETPLDPVLVETATPLLKEAGLSNEAANKLLPLIPKVQEQLVKQQADAFEVVRSDWAKEAKADPEIGGKNWDDTTRLAARALDHYGARSEKDDKGNETNEFRKLLNESGLGNHPVMLRMFRGIGADLSEDGTFVRNTVAAKENQPREVKNYPEDQPKG